MVELKYRAFGAEAAEKTFTKRHSRQIAHIVAGEAMAIMVLGYVEEGNRLISALFEENALEGKALMTLRHTLLAAWSYTKKWPSFILEFDPQKSNYKQPFFGKKCTHIDQKWDLLESELEEWINSTRDREWPEELEGAGANPTMEHLETALSAVDRADQLRTRLGVEDLVSAAIEIALELGKSPVAESLLRKHISPHFQGVRSTTNWNVHKIARVRKVWPLFCKRIVAEEAKISEESVKDYVDQGLELVKRRFREGPPRPYAHLNIHELLQVMENEYLEEVSDFFRNTDGSDDDDEEDDAATAAVKTLLHPGASRREIHELGQKLGGDGSPVELPEDYKAFLRITNGFYVKGSGSPSHPLYAIENVHWDDNFVDMEFGVEMLPHEYIADSAEVTWPQGRAFSVGAGGDEGCVWLIAPEYTKAALAEFERAYQGASEDDQRRYEQAAMDIYGGLDAMRRVEWLVIQWYHWRQDLDPYGSFRSFLEECINHPTIR